MSRDDGVKAHPEDGEDKDAAPKKKAAKRANRGVPSRGQRKALGATASRAGRDHADDARLEDGLVLSEADRAQFLRDAAMQSMLPDPPKIAGVHWFWATTAKDAKPPLKWYLQLGYKIMRSDDRRLGQWADATRTGKGGEFDGTVMVNEMILTWCTVDVYRQIMRVIHHDRPMEEGQRLRERREEIVDATGRDRKGKPLVTNEGDDEGIFDAPNRRVVGRPSQFEA